jgi:glutamate--cysteine ligase
MRSAAAPETVLRTADDAEAYVASICFKTGPPERVGVELEWIVHPADDPTGPLDLAALSAALGAHAPRTLAPDSPHHPLRGGSTVTVEPGGQVEISTPPFASLAAIQATVDADLRQLADLLDTAGLRLASTAIDAHRQPRQLLHTPRYDAMAHAFARQGADGLVMMGSTAGLQVCPDAGRPHRYAVRWSALHELGPVLLATFANSPRHAGRDTGWASARMRTWFGMDPARTRPVGSGTGDPALGWARYALAAPLLCVRRPGPSWRAPAGVTFADWVSGALTRPPTIDDLNYHLSTLFPPVRPRGYLEVRYLDTQPPGEWLAPVAVITALLADEATVDAARDLCAPVADRWTEAARSGLADPLLAGAAGAVLDLACRALDRTDLPAADRDRVTAIVHRRLTGRRPVTVPEPKPRTRPRPQPQPQPQPRQAGGWETPDAGRTTLTPAHEEER